MKNTRRVIRAQVLLFAAVLTMTTALWAADPKLTVVPQSPYTGPQTGSGNSAYRPYDSRENLAFPGNGFAQPAVAYNTIVGWSHRHQARFANDGNYGNGRSWVGISNKSFRDKTWVKIDLGRSATITEIRFGETRLQCLGDRTATTFKIETAMFDAVYANGNEANDALEYKEIANSQGLGYNANTMEGCKTLSIKFDPIEARFLKISVTRNGTRIDEIEVFGPKAHVIGAATVSDINDNGSTEFATLRELANGNSQVEVKDSETKEQLNLFTLQHTNNRPAGIASIPDIDGNGHPEFALLFVQPNGRGEVIIIDALDGLLINKLRFFSRDWESMAIVASDLDDNGTPEIGVAADRDDGTGSAIQVQDPLTGQTLRWIGMPAD